MGGATIGTVYLIGYYLANEPRQPNTDLVVTDKFTGEVTTRVALADARPIDNAIGAAVAAAAPMRRLPPYKRQTVLNHCVARFCERQEELALALRIEAGKPIKDSGLGRESIRYAIEDMTEPRLLVIRDHLTSR